MLLLTATATRRVQEDILISLGIGRCLTFSQSFNRPNLLYRVEKKTKQSFQEMVNFITKQYPQESGIIYCLSRKDCERLAERLRAAGLDAEHYHADLAPEERETVQQRWTDGTTKVICATIAFGMGINKPDVRYVIHYSMPKCLENYYQESGRAGRDGEISHCILYYSYADKFRLEALAEKNATNPQNVKTVKENINRVVEYCENEIDCRRRMQLAV